MSEVITRNIDHKVVIAFAHDHLAIIAVVKTTARLPG